MLYENQQIRGGINLESYLDYPPNAPGGTAEPFPVTAAGVSRPMLLLGSARFDRRQELDRSWSVLAALSGRWVHSARIADANHWIFTDYPQPQTAGLMAAAGRDALIGTVDPTVSVPKVRRTVRRFFVRHLAAR
ncbi:hypothetical protein [Nonomuraea sediminis]|uniref:hypothetical protein n=1 Tax=Nonomuraea sediminis TaxID=2835864 RepID=UPI001BDC14BE|nr:hypothetical protein [Nonomuraea sediminis]